MSNPKIDWTAPLQLQSHSFADGREVEVVSAYPNGWARVEVVQDKKLGAIMFDEFGNYVMADEGNTTRGSALSIRNAPRTTTVYLRLSKYADDNQTSVSPTPQSGTGCASIKLTLTEGIVTGVELDRANIEPITRIKRMFAEPEDI